MVWEAGRLGDAISESLEEIEHRHQHRRCETTRMAMNDRCRCVIKWNLMDLKVDVRCY
ncbi:hypothetical protein DL98DRAFT_518316 [Cadophora sp. DSE1049]|nr:hypothetical protein DL98DRAFT_518316 [Cadophora sp. DSE1049]